MSQILRIGDQGADVRALQAAVNARLHARDLGDQRIRIDGILGEQTAAAASLVLYALGVTGKRFTQSKVKSGGIIDVRAQEIIEHPDTRTPAMLDRARARRSWVKAHAANAERVNPNVVVRIDVPSHSPRGAAIDGIVLHSTEGPNSVGVKDLQGLGDYFLGLRPPNRTSAHVATDGEGQSARYVPDVVAAWHCADFNSRKLGIEQIGFAAQTVWPEEQLEETARWCAFWCDKYSLPVAHSTNRGICMHSDLGAAGGGHHDPGENFPLAHVLDLTRHYLALRKRA